MTTPLNVNPGDVEVTASSLQELTAELGGAIPTGAQVTVWPTGAATALIHANVSAATAAMQNRVEQNASKLSATGQQYAGADKHEAGKLGDVMKLSDFTQPVGQVVGQVMNALGSITGNFGEAAMYPLSGVIGAVSGATINKPDHSPTPPAQNNPGSLTPDTDSEHESGSGDSAPPPHVHVGHHASEQHAEPHHG